MKKRQTFRPSVVDLEARRTPSHVLAATHLAKAPAPPVDVAFARTGVYQTPSQLAEHAGYVALTKGGGASGVVFFGDSLTYYWGDARNPQAPGTPAWVADFAPLGAANFGVFGDRTENVLWRVENGELDGRPKVAVLMIGINDLGVGRTPAQAAQNIQVVVRAIHAESPSTKIFLEGLLPTSLSTIGNKTLQVNARIARTPHVTYLNPGARMAVPGGGIQPALTIDGLHLSVEGYQVLAAALVGPVRAALEA